MRIANAPGHNSVGSQKRTSVFDSTTRENCDLRFDFKALALQSANFERLHSRSVGIRVNVSEVGMRQNFYIRRIYRCDRSRKPGRLACVALVPADLPKLRLEPGWIDRRMGRRHSQQFP